MRVENKVALVTGGARGIGLGIALKLAETGFTLAITGRRAADQVQPVLEQIKKHSRHSIYVQADVASASDRPSLAGGRRAAWQAGCPGQQRGYRAPRPRRYSGGQRRELRRTDRDQSQRTLFPDSERCVLDDSPARAGRFDHQHQFCVGHGRQREPRRLLHLKGRHRHGHELWAVRLAEYGIGVYEVRPGIIETDMTEGVKGKYDALIEGGILLEKRWGTPDDVGKAVSVLARGELPYATGAVLVLDGGLTLARL